MPVRWFRISFARNAFVRALATQDLDLETLSVMHGIRAMASFFEESKPQHAELDELECRWSPVEGGWELAIVRRMRRHDHPEAQLRLVFGYTASDQRTSSGSASIRTWRDARELDGYLATRGARPRYRRLDQS